jgi:DnaJ-class molecular chaperone
LSEWEYQLAEECTQIQKCIRCDYISSSTKELHNWEIQENLENQEGNNIRTCTRCGRKEKETKEPMPCSICSGTGIITDSIACEYCGNGMDGKGDTCMACGGSGSIGFDGTCPKCDGTGQSKNGWTLEWKELSEVNSTNA